MSIVNCPVCEKQKGCKYKDLFEYVRNKADKIRECLHPNSPIKVGEHCRDFELANKETVDAFVKEWESTWIK